MSGSGTWNFGDYAKIIWAMQSATNVRLQNFLGDISNDCWAYWFLISFHNNYCLFSVISGWYTNQFREVRQTLFFGEVYQLSELSQHSSVYCGRILYAVRSFSMSFGIGHWVSAEYDSPVLYAHNSFGGVPVVERQCHPPSDWPWIFGISKGDTARTSDHVQSETE